MDGAQYVSAELQMVEHLVLQQGFDGTSYPRTVLSSRDADYRTCTGVVFSFSWELLLHGKRARAHGAHQTLLDSVLLGCWMKLWVKAWRGVQLFNFAPCLERVAQSEVHRTPGF